MVRAYIGGVRFDAGSLSGGEFVGDWGMKNKDYEIRNEGRKDAEKC